MIGLLGSISLAWILIEIYENVSKCDKLVMVGKMTLEMHCTQMVIVEVLAGKIICGLSEKLRCTFNYIVLCAKMD